jgi:hypothetical protein
MIINKICGGLGNQMFQYALGKHLSIINNTNHKIDVKNYKGKTLDLQKGIREFELDCFNIGAKKATNEDIEKTDSFFTKNKFGRKLFRLCSNKNNYFNKKYILEPPANYFKFDPQILQTLGHKDVYIDGYWQTEKYFKNIEKDIRKDFTFKNKPSGENNKLIEKIKECNSVSLHVRHGDNVHIENGILMTMEYYNKAIEVITSKIKEPTFFIFSDDPEWASKNIKLQYPTIFVKNNLKQATEDLRLMTYCKHHILGNSTFSWWGAWLGEKANQIVVCPTKYLDSKLDILNTDYKPEKWIFV